MSRTCWIAVWTVALTPLAAPAQEYTIKFAKSAPGETYQVKSDNQSDVTFKLLDAGGGVVMDKNEVKGHQFTYREVGLERGPGGDLIKLKRMYKKAQRTLDGDRRTLLFQGETLLIDKKEGASTFQIVDGEAVDGEDAKELREEFNKGGVGKLLELFLPKKAVKVDEAWKIDATLVAKEFMKDGKVEVDAAKSTGAGKLLKAYQKSGKQFGVIGLTITLPITALINDGNKTPTKLGKLVIKIELDRCIDGGVDQSELKTWFDGDIRGEINANGMDFGLEITIQGKAEETRVPLAK
jgi:hypothetical protein